VLNLRVRFGLPRQAPTPQTRLIFVRVHNRVVALTADSAREFRRIPAETIRPIESTLQGIDRNYVTGVATVRERLVLLLDIAAILRVEETVAPAAAVANS
jgi:purine-binding chemotaxis protein CheW